MFLAGLVHLFRLIGWLLIALAIVAFGWEAIAALHIGEWRSLAFGEAWATVSLSSLNLAQAVVQRYLHPVLWDPVITTVLFWPAWAVLGAPGLALLLLAKKRTRRRLFIRR